MTGDSFSVINRETLRKPRQSRIRPRPAHLCAVSLHGHLLGGPNPRDAGNTDFLVVQSILALPLSFSSSLISFPIKHRISPHVTPAGGLCTKTQWNIPFSPSREQKYTHFTGRKVEAQRRACQLSRVAFLNPLNGEVLNQIQSTA